MASETFNVDPLKEAIKMAQDELQKAKAMRTALGNAKRRWDVARDAQQEQPTMAQEEIKNASLQELRNARQQSRVADDAVKNTYAATVELAGTMLVEAARKLQQAVQQELEQAEPVSSKRRRPARRV